MKHDFKAFYFKTKIILLDDNKLFLKALDHKLSSKYDINAFTDPNEALDYIVSNYEDNVATNASNFVVEAINEDDDQFYSIEFSKIQGLLHNSKKTNTITVIVVDYSMPLMNGIEFCEKIAHIPALKIMLTGHADINIAINAFNRKIIDRFLVKDGPDMFEAISDDIELMQKDFFEKQSYPLLNCLSANKNTLINSCDYNNHFRDILRTLNAIEYYLLDALGSYVIITNKKIKYYFIVLLDRQLDELIDIAKNSDATPDLFNKMVSKTHTLILLREEDYKIPVATWNDILHPIDKMNNYYYCLVPERSLPISHNRQAPALI